MKRSLCVVALACGLAGCSTVKVREEAKGVRLVFTEPALAKCSFRGDVVGSEGLWFNSWLIANDTLSYAALNDIRNHAHELGADTVFIPVVNQPIQDLGDHHRPGLPLHAVTSRRLP